MVSTFTNKLIRHCQMPFALACRVMRLFWLVERRLSMLHIAKHNVTYIRCMWQSGYACSWQLPTTEIQIRGSQPGIAIISMEIKECPEKDKILMYIMCRFGILYETLEPQRPYSGGMLQSLRFELVDCWLYSCCVEWKRKSSPKCRGKSGPV